MNKQFLILTVLMLTACSSFNGQEDIHSKCIHALEKLTQKIQNIPAEQTNNTESIDIEKVLLIDASLSMNQQVDNQKKIDEVKGMVMHIAENYPHTLNDIKIYSFGNAHDGCSASNKIHLSNKRLKDEVRDLKLGSEIGKSPIINTVKSIVEEHQKVSNKPIEITVISDGAENCLSPEESIQILTELKLKSNVNIKLHLVGYNTSESQNKQLKRLVEVTNGVFLPIKNGIELKEQVPALLDDSFGFISVEKPLEINEFTSWKVYNQDKLLASYSDSNFGFDNESPIKMKTGTYGFCLNIGHSVFVRQVRVNNGEVSNIKLTTLSKY